MTSTFETQFVTDYLARRDAEIAALIAAGMNRAEAQKVAHEKLDSEIDHTQLFAQELAQADATQLAQFWSELYVLTSSGRRIDLALVLAAEHAGLSSSFAIQAWSRGSRLSQALGCPQLARGEEIGDVCEVMLTDVVIPAWNALKK